MRLAAWFSHRTWLVDPISVPPLSSLTHQQSDSRCIVLEKNREVNSTLRVLPFTSSFLSWRLMCLVSWSKSYSSAYRSSWDTCALKCLLCGWSHILQQMLKSWISMQAVKVLLHLLVPALVWDLSASCSALVFFCFCHNGCCCFGFPGLESRNPAHYWPIQSKQTLNKKRLCLTRGFVFLCIVHTG